MGCMLLFLCLVFVSGFIIVLRIWFIFAFLFCLFMQLLYCCGRLDSVCVAVGLLGVYFVVWLACGIVCDLCFVWFLVIVLCYDYCLYYGDLLAAC